MTVRSSLPGRLQALCAHCVLLLLFTQFVVAERDPIRLTHGPMLGHVTSSSVRVWARTSDPGAFLVKFGLDTHDLFREIEGTTAIGSDKHGFGHAHRTTGEHDLSLSGVRERPATRASRFLSNPAQHRTDATSRPQPGRPFQLPVRSRILRQSKPAAWCWPRIAHRTVH